MERILFAPPERTIADRFVANKAIRDSAIDVY